MNKPTFYEQVGIIIPGAIFLFGLLLFMPAMRELLVGNGVSLGQFGMFVLLSYAAGHLIAALGNVAESVAWHLAGGMPTDWVLRKQTTLVSEHQRVLVVGKVRNRLGITIEELVGFDRKTWFPISRQIYAHVERDGLKERLETFNGNYGLNRGLAVGCVVLAGVAFILKNWPVGLGLIAASFVYAFRAYRFAVHYGRELYMQFLTLSDATAPTQNEAR